MASIEHLQDLPMTALEEQLKKCLGEWPDLAGRILSSQELSEYITWMIKTYGASHASTARSMLPYFTPLNNMTRLASRLIENSEDPEKLPELSESYAVQSEEGFIAPDRDISIGRMLRYMPSQWHTNTYFEMYYAFSGTCPVHFQGETVMMKRGTVLIVAPGIAHACPCHADDAVLVFYMMRKSTFQHVFWDQLTDDNLLSKFFHLALNGGQATSYLQFETGDDPEVMGLLTRIYEEHQQNGPYTPQMLNALMRVAFLVILRGYEGTARLPRNENFYWKHQFSAILSYIQTHYQDTSLKDLGERFHYSTRQVGRIVQDCTGKSFGALTREMKMKRSGELLRDGRYSIEQISGMVGYSTVSSFYRAFIEFYGSTPVAWLRQNQEESV